MENYKEGENRIGKGGIWRRHKNRKRRVGSAKEV